MHGGLHPWEPTLEVDTTHNLFRGGLPKVPRIIQQQVRSHGGYVAVPMGDGLGVEPDRDEIARFKIA